MLRGTADFLRKICRLYKLRNFGKNTFGIYSGKFAEKSGFVLEKRNAVWILLTALTISLVIVGGSLSLSLRQEKSAAQGTTYSEAATEAGYTMRITDGQVGLFREGSSVPYQKLQVPLNLLSDYDRHALEQGITVSDEAALQRLIEDYFS